MSVISTLGFDDQSTHEWVYIGNPEIIPGGPFSSSGYYLRPDNTGDAVRLFTYSDQTEFTFSFYIQISTLAYRNLGGPCAYVGYTNTYGTYQTTQLRLYISTTGQIAVYRNTTLLAISGGVYHLEEDSWHHIKFTGSIHASSGQIKVYVNGQLLINESGVNTDEAASGVCNIFQVNGVASGTFYYTLFDDLIVTDVFDDTFLQGSIPRITDILVPDGDSSVEWNGPSTSPTTNYTQIDEVGNNDGGSTQVTIDIQDKTDLYTLSNPIGNTTNIKGVMASVDAGNLPQQLNTSNEIGTPTAFFIRPNGRRIYVVDDGEPEAVYQYDMGSPGWDLDTATYSSPGSFSINSEGDLPHGIWFKDDGTEMYILFQNHRIYIYTLGTAWDVTSASIGSPKPYLNVDTGAFQSSTGLSFSADGTKLYTPVVYSGNLNEYIRQYGSATSPPTAWDVANFTYEGAWDIEYITTNPRGMYWKQDGSKIFLIDAANGFIAELSCGSPEWNILSNRGFIQDHDPPIPFDGTFPIDIFFSPDGTQMYVLWYDKDTIYQFDIGSPGWNPSNIDFNYISNVIKSGTTTSVAVRQKMVDDDYKEYRTFYELNPDTGVEWTASDLTSLIIGMKSRE